MSIHLSINFDDLFDPKTNLLTTIFCCVGSQTRQAKVFVLVNYNLKMLELFLICI